MKTTTTITFLLLELLLGPVCVLAQVITGNINTYVKVTSIVNSQTLTLANLSGPATDIGPGTRVLVIQMKGAAITTANTAAFGSLTNLNNAGNYEFATVQSLVGVAPGPYTLTLTQQLTRSYTPADFVQVVSTPTYGNVSVVGTLTCPPWNDATGTGGVLNLQVNGTLYIQGHIHANGRGFAGGAVNPTQDGGCGDSTVFRAGTANVARKGGGIADWPTGMERGRGRLVNGGGGGVVHNGGGGGGANWTYGGKGGNGWPGACGNWNAGGQGGANLAYSPAADRLFLGGGGGGGQQNNNAAGAGGAGGGIVIIRAAVLDNTLGCPTEYSIRANGANGANTTGNDAGGGGGSGGVVLLDVQNYVTNCALHLSASGGNGGNVINGDVHGGGGGGGVGPVIYTYPPFRPLSIQTEPGAPGLDDNVGPPNTTAGGGGPCNPCTLSGWNPTPLPVHFQSFTGEWIAESTTELRWEVALELNASHYVLEHSPNNRDFVPIAHREAVGTTTEAQAYRAQHPQATARVNYYRVKQVDLDGGSAYTETIALVSSSLRTQLFALAQNPAQRTLNVWAADPSSGGPTLFQITDPTGRVAASGNLSLGTEVALVEIPCPALARGTYVLRLTAPSGESHAERFVWIE